MASPRTTHAPMLRPRPAGCGFLGNAHLHLLLARRSHCAVRPRLFGVLCRRHRRAGDRQGGSLVHSRRHAFLLRRARSLCRKLFDVYARWRLPRRERSTGRHIRQTQRLGADVRLHPDRPYLRRLRRPIHYRPAKRDADGLRLARLAAAGHDGWSSHALLQFNMDYTSAVLPRRDHLLLVGKHQRH